MVSIPQGYRNTTLASLAGHMRQVGLDPDAIRAALLATKARFCSQLPGLIGMPRLFLPRKQGFPLFSIWAKSDNNRLACFRHRE